MNKIQSETFASGVDIETCLTAREAIFVQWYVDTRNVMQAYRQAYDVATDARPASVYVAGMNVLKSKKVMLAVREAQDRAAAETIVKAADMLQDLYDIATADPNELTKGQLFACRHCHGVDFQEQWRDPQELARAMDAYLRQPQKLPKGVKRLPMPTALGGFGYDHNAEPNPICPRCYGDGRFHARPPDTTKLTPKARKLYKGLEVKADGTIKVLMHDQMQARDMIIKMLGAYKDGKAGQVAPGTAAPIPSDATPEEAQRAYLKLVQG